MFPPNLLALLADGAPPPDDAPEPLPSLPLAGVAPPPAAPPGQPPGRGLPPSMMVPPPVNFSQHHSAADFVRQLAPLLMSTLAARRDPMAGAAMLNGIMRGQMMARQEQMTAEKRAADTEQQKRAFMQHVLTDVRGIKDPQQQQQYLQLAEDVGVKTYGMQPEIGRAHV